MPISVRESEIKRLVRFYRNAVQEIAREFIGSFDFERARLAAQGRQVFQLLEELDEKTTRWARRNIEQLYRASSSEAEKTFRRQFGFDKIARERAKQFSLVNEQAIQALLNDPEVGFLSGIRNGFQQIKDRMKVVQNQARMFQAKQVLFDETIARVGFLEGQSLGTMRDRIVDDLVSLKNSSELKWLPQALKLPQDNIVRNVANLPFVKIPDRRSRTGFRNLRVDHYAEMLARTKTGQAANLARRNRALAHNVPLIQISKNKPLRDDACFLYIGKVFALTEAARHEYGIPHVSELPNGGAPFHPNCTHTERQFVAEFKDPRELKLAMEPPPAWALNRPWGAVQAEYRRRGGAKAANRYNKAAKEMGRTTGGRERRRKEDGLPPDTKPPPRPPGPSGPTPQPPRPQKMPPAPELAYQAPVGFQIPTELASLQVNETWGNLLGIPKYKKQLQEVFERATKKLAKELSVKVAIETGGFGAWGGAVNPNTVIKLVGNEAKAKQLASTIGWTFGQEATYGFKVLRKGSRAAKAAKSKGVLIKLKRPLTQKELQLLAKQKGIPGFTPVGKDRLWFGITEEIAPEVFQMRVMKAIETATKRMAQEVVKSTSIESVKDFYHEKLVSVVKRNKNLHQVIRETRKELHQIANAATRSGDIPEGSRLIFNDKFRLQEVTKPTTWVRDMIEMGPAPGMSEAKFVEEVGTVLRKELERTAIRPSRKKIEEALKLKQEGEKQVRGVELQLQALRRARVESGKYDFKDLLHGKIPQTPEMEALENALNGLLRNQAQLNRAYSKANVELYERFTEESQRLLREVRSFGSKGVSQNIVKRSNQKIVEMSEEVMDMFPTDWVRKSAELPSSIHMKGETRVGVGGGYLPGRREIPARMSIITNQSDGGIRGSAIHEWVHRIEDANTALGRAEAAFYRKRTTLLDGTREPAIKLGPEDGFPPGTYIRKDKWALVEDEMHTLYMGREYPVMTTGGKFWEILSNSIQGLYGFKHEVRAKLMKDPELLNFVLGALAAL